MPYLRIKNRKLVYGPDQGDVTTSAVSNAETLLGSIRVPANTFITGQCINIIARIVKTTTNGITAIRLRIGPNGDASDPLVGGYTATTSTHQMIPIFRQLTYFNNTTTYVLTPTDNAAYDVYANNSVSSVAIDWTSSQVITITGLNTTAVSDDMCCMFIKTKAI